MLPTLFHNFSFKITLVLSVEKVIPVLYGTRNYLNIKLNTTKLSGCCNILQLQCRKCCYCNWHSHNYVAIYSLSSLKHLKVSHQLNGWQKLAEDIQPVFLWTAKKWDFLSKTWQDFTVSCKGGKSCMKYTFGVGLGIQRMKKLNVWNQCVKYNTDVFLTQANIFLPQMKCSIVCEMLVFSMLCLLFIVFSRSFYAYKDVVRKAGHGKHGKSNQKLINKFSKTGKWCFFTSNKKQNKNNYNQLLASYTLSTFLIHSLHNLTCLCG